MPSTAIIGLPGGGKSYYATLRITQLLKSDPRTIVTNIPLNLEALQALYPQDFALKDRVVLLDPLDFDSAKSFYLIRARRKKLPYFPADLKEFSSEDENGENNVDPQKVRDFFGPGIIYFLDEVHQFLNARNWKAVGPDILRYLSMHRHFGDDIYWITQAPQNVDKQWRSLTQSYFTCRNFKFEKFRGMSKGSKLEVRETLNIPGPHNQEVAQTVITYQLDPKITACYSTSVLATEADINQKAGGLSYKWIIALIFLVLIGGSIAIVFGSKALISKVFPGFAGDQPEQVQQDKTPFLPIQDQSIKPLPSPTPAVFIIRDEAPYGFSSTTLSPRINVRDKTPEAVQYAILPPEVSEYSLQGKLTNTRGFRLLILDGTPYADGETLPNGHSLSIDKMATIDPSTNRLYHLSNRPVRKTVGFTPDLYQEGKPVLTPASAASIFPQQ